MGKFRVGRNGKGGVVQVSGVDASGDGRGIQKQGAQECSFKLLVVGHVVIPAAAAASCQVAKGFLGVAAEWAPGALASLHVAQCADRAVEVQAQSG